MTAGTWPGAGRASAQGEQPGARPGLRRFRAPRPERRGPTRSSRARDGLIPIRARILARAGVPWPQAFAISRYWLGPEVGAPAQVGH